MNNSIKLATLLTSLAAILPHTVWAEGDAKTVVRLRADEAILTSQGLRGRDTPGEYGDKAASWVASRFAECGLTPLPGKNGFQNEFPLVSVKLDESQTRLTLLREGGRDELNWGERFFCFPQGVTPVDTTLEVALCGYGLVIPKLGRDDYGAAAKGRAAIVIAGIGDADPATVGPYGSPPFKAAVAGRAGAALLVVVYPDRPGGAWPPEEIEIKNKIASATKPILGLEGTPARLPVIYLKGSELEGIVNCDSVGIQVASGRFRPEAMKGAKIRLRIGFTDKSVQHSANIIGMVPGTTGQFVILGAHYDHLGVVEAAGRDALPYYPGADDNASGVAGLLEICRRWASPDAPKPRRTLIAVAFGCEEDGLLGSEYLAGHLPVPNDSIAAMVNLDMIGRRGFASMRDVKAGDSPDSLYAAAFYCAGSPELRNLIRAAADILPLHSDIRAVNSFAHFGDAASFQEIGLPTIHIFSGFHADYHETTDTMDKLDFAKMAQMVNLIDGVVHNISEYPAKISFDPAIKVEERGMSH